MDEVKYAWFNEQLVLEDWFLRPHEVLDVLNGENLDKYGPALIDYVLDLEKDWENEQL